MFVVKIKHHMHLIITLQYCLYRECTVMSVSRDPTHCRLALYRSPVIIFIHIDVLFINVL